MLVHKVAVHMGVVHKEIAHKEAAQEVLVGVARNLDILHMVVDRTLSGMNEPINNNVDPMINSNEDNVQKSAKRARDDSSYSEDEPEETKKNQITN